MLPAAMRRRKAAHHRTEIDGDLLSRTGLDELSLCRLRKALWRRFGALSYRDRTRLLEGGMHARLTFLNDVLRQTLPPAQWARWLRYIEHGEEDLADMARGEYPVSPYLIRLYSALFGIRVEYLLVGQEPEPSPQGVRIDLFDIGPDDFWLGRGPGRWPGPGVPGGR